MNKEFFDALVKDRTDNANTLEKPSMRGVKSSVVDKYSDQAHFVYELLQNADDAKATYARFKLYHDRLIFTHNGTRHFSVSNPASEDLDRENDRLGDVNAILSIGNSTKTGQNTIGKFGVGFKAVFQYTATPYIYDSEIRFKIERFFVPVLLENDHSERKENETLFEFPFNHDENDAETAFKAISERLSTLVNPILFLSNLQEISFEFDDTKGAYRKEITKTYPFDNTKAERIILTQDLGEKSQKRTLLLFSRIDEESGRYSVGFYLDEKGNLLPVDEYAYCFFPTKENTNLHFIIHAPFLLTDSREKIKSGDKHNRRMINLLSDLAADCMVYLRDIGIQEHIKLISDNIIKIIPVNEMITSQSWNKKVYSDFNPFYAKILQAFKTEKIIPTKSLYTTSKNAYWAQSLSLTAVFNNKILRALTGNPNANWVFASIPRDRFDGYFNSTRLYIDIIISSWLDEDRILSAKYITPNFIQACSIQWLADFYKWISETKSRINRCKTLPIFLSSDGKAVPAYDNEGKLILFFPSDEVNDYTIISEKLLDNEEILSFVESFGITKPSLKNEIFNKILPKFKKGEEFDSRQYFKKLFDYYCYECPEVEKDNYIQEIKQYSILRYMTSNKDGFFREQPKNMYFPTEELQKYFSVKPSTKFVDWNGYLELVGKENEKLLKSFLVELGVFSDAIIKIYPLSNPYPKYNYNWSRSTGKEKWSESVIDGCSENITYIVDNHDSERSFYLWKIIIDIIRTQNHGISGYDIKDLSRYLWVRHEYYFRTDKTECINSIDVPKLKYEKWLLDKSGNFVSPSEIYVTDLSDEYDKTSPEAKIFISFLGMLYEDPKLSRLTPEQKKAIAIAAKLKEAGISPEELEAFLEEHKRKKSLPAISNEVTPDDSNDNSAHSSKRQNSSDKPSKPKQHRMYTLDLEDDVDSDEYTPKTVDYQKKIEKAKAKSEAEIDLIEQLEELQQKAVDSERYSYGWFKALLELETRESNENAENSKEVSISLGKVEREVSSNRTLILKQPSSYIPRFMEELADIPLILEFENETKKLPIEVISIRSFTLRVKLKPNADISNLNFHEVKEARIIAQNPVFLLDELKNQFLKLGFDDDFNMQENLCSNIDFIFGPPGTGKTTYLANEIIIPIMKRTEKSKILVLTPTNKAADVIVKKIQEMIGNDDSYLNWLVRFGSTDDETIEKSSIFKDKTFDLRNFERIVMVTTIDRFPYDFFMPNGERHYIRNQKYDYIIFDEASMIPLIKIIYPLFCRKPRKFIVAGDPFQIEPVVHLDMWKGENIYTMVKLTSFAEPKTIPHNYEIKLLTKQYRSIPVIGELFSKMTYDGILEHHRTADKQFSINFGKILEVKPLNIIKFPVSKYESIYRAKRLNGKTPYHIYSALFAYEFTVWLAGIIHQHNSQKSIRIGVIAAYKAQADMIERLISSIKIPDTISVQTGTIHGFQGDECEIIISVYNPPPSISPKKEMFLNKKNIINVSISRARDYLFIIMPDDDTENIDNLILLKKMEQFMKKSGQYTESFSHAIEKRIFGVSDYLEINSFSTSHQNVNVYGLPEQIYEIRSEETAIDIQVLKKPNAFTKSK